MFSVVCKDSFKNLKDVWVRIFKCLGFCSSVLICLSVEGGELSLIVVIFYVL